MTLDEMLALLPDNTTGEISPADLRAIVSDLYDAAHTTGDSYAYKWSTSGGAPNTGYVTMDQPWQTFATTLRISETTSDGLALGFGVLDGAVAARIWLSTAAGAKLTATVTGPSVDQGPYRDVPISVQSIVGNQPANNSAVTVSIAVVT